jgi:hypothetical protein
LATLNDQWRRRGLRNTSGGKAEAEESYACDNRQEKLCPAKAWRAV